MIGALEIVQIFQLLFICNHNLLRLNVFESSNVLTVSNPKVIIFLKVFLSTYFWDFTPLFKNKQ